MRVYNTLSGKKEELKTLNPHKVGIYVCGPTTYNYIHLGNARPLVVFDTVRRYLEYKGYEVNYVLNFTDVDDKIINRARQEGQEAIELAAHYIDEYFQDADALNIKRAQVHPRVSQHIPEIIEAVEGLIDKGFAYETEGDVYFRVKAFKDYGKLSGRSLDEMLAGARVEIDERKEEAVDFALWKAAKEGEPFWESPWGQGRPGWHIECSVMSIKYLGETFDIHGGGSDLIFPHHENEIAQAEALSGKTFVNYWMHNGFITVNNEKMSKSLGNFFILRDILEKYSADVVRFYLIATHYRSPLDFDDGKLEEARKALGRLQNTLLLADEYTRGYIEESQEVEGKGLLFLNSVIELENKFVQAMDDDFNTAKAIGFLFEMSHNINAFLAEVDRDSVSERNAVLRAMKVFSSLGDILGIFMEKTKNEEEMAEKILEIFAGVRQLARKEKEFQLADEIREFLNDLEVTIEDTANGSRFRYSGNIELPILVEKLIELRSRFKKEKKKNYDRADFLRDTLQAGGIILEDTREGVRWKLADA